MALPLCSSRPLSAFRVQQTKFPIKTSSINLHFNQQKAQLQFSASSKRFHLFFPVKSASVNGYPVSKENDASFADSEKVDLSEKLKKWIKFVREILPGGDWWRLSTEEAEDVVPAKTVTVMRALKKMWELVAEDRWVIFTAFLALIVTAVCSIQS